jgi:hypothetical protein
MQDGYVGAEANLPYQGTVRAGNMHLCHRKRMNDAMQSVCDHQNMAVPMEELLRCKGKGLFV